MSNEEDDQSISVERCNKLFADMSQLKKEQALWLDRLHSLEMKRDAIQRDLDDRENLLTQTKNDITAASSENAPAILKQITEVKEEVGHLEQQLNTLNENLSDAKAEGNSHNVKTADLKKEAIKIQEIITQICEIFVANAPGAPKNNISMH